MLTTGAATVPTSRESRLPDPHWEHGDGARVMTRPTMMTAKHGVGVGGGLPNLAAYRKDFFM